MKKIIAILILALAVQGTAQAQLGGLLNKAKDAVKKETQKTVNKSTERTETKLSEQAEKQISQSTASTTDIDPYLGVSMSQLKASYEKLDPNIYYAPYHREPNFFYANSGNETNNLFMSQRTILAWQMSSGKDSPPVVYEWGKGFPGIPAEFIINANFAVFKAFPKQAYPLFLEARTLLRAMENGKIRVDVEDASTICGYKKGDELFFKASPDKKHGFGYKRGLIEYVGDVNAPASDLIKQWKAEEARLLKLYKENTPFENVKNTFFNTMVESVNLSKQQNWGIGLYKGYQLELAAEDMKTHPKKVEDKDYVRKTIQRQLSQMGKTHKIPMDGYLGSIRLQCAGESTESCYQQPKIRGRDDSHCQNNLRRWTRTRESSYQISRLELYPQRVWRYHRPLSHGLHYFQNERRHTPHGGYRLQTTVQRQLVR